MPTRGQLRRLEMQNSRLRRKIGHLKKGNKALVVAVQKAVIFTDRYRYIADGLGDEIGACEEETEEEMEFIAEHTAMLIGALEAVGEKPSGDRKGDPR